MPKAEVRGILARPGEFKRKDNSVVRKTWEELKRAFYRTPELMLTLGHPLTPQGRPRFPEARDYLGRVIPIVNEDRHIIEGIFKFHDEDWDKLPPHIQQKIVNDEALEISLGYTAQTLESGEKAGMLHNHVALLVDGESPVCPLGECGINIRLESEDGDIELMTYEQASSTKEEEEPATEEEETVQIQPRTITFTEEQFTKLLETLSPKTPEPSGDEPEKAQPEPAEPAPEPSQEPELEPPRAFPTGSPDTKEGPKYLQEDGSVVVPHEHYLGSTKKEQ